MLLLTGSHTQRDKAQLKKIVAAGLAHIVVGTHALLESDVEFHKLGLAIMEEGTEGASYTQPAQGQQILPGTQLASDTDWYAQALHQHHLATYLAILTGTPVDMAALPQPDPVRVRKARLVELIARAASAAK